MYRDETFYWVCQDANYNVLGIVDGNGDLKERYEYTPYGQRTVFKSAGSEDLLCLSPILDSQPVQVSSVDQPYGLCDFGHQGLLFDKEFSKYYVRTRYLDAVLARMIQGDPTGYPDGANRFEWLGSTPENGVDPFGTDFIAIGDRRVQWTAGFYHYLATYWRCDCPLKTGGGELFHKKGYTDKELEKICAGPGGTSSNPKGSAEQLGITQLDGSPDWSVWAQVFSPSQQLAGKNPWIWDKRWNIWIAYIRFDGERATRTMPIYEATPEEVKAKWGDVVGKARAYEYAEHPEDGFDPLGGAATKFKNWPRSNYYLFGTNSNTFVRTIIRRSELSWQEMSGSHPGDDQPQLNDLDNSRGGGALIPVTRGVPTQTPWKGSKNAKPVPTDPIP